MLGEDLKQPPTSPRLFPNGDGSGTPRQGGLDSDGERERPGSPLGFTSRRLSKWSFASAATRIRRLSSRCSDGGTPQARQGGGPVIPAALQSPASPDPVVAEIQKLREDLGNRLTALEKVVQQLSQERDVKREPAAPAMRTVSFWGRNGGAGNPLNPSARAGSTRRMLQDKPALPPPQQTDDSLLRLGVNVSSFHERLNDPRTPLTGDSSSSSTEGIPTPPIGGGSYEYDDGTDGRQQTLVMGADGRQQTIVMGADGRQQTIVMGADGRQQTIVMGADGRQQTVVVRDDDDDDSISVGKRESGLGEGRTQGKTRRVSNFSRGRGSEVSLRHRGSIGPVVRNGSVAESWHPEDPWDEDDGAEPLLLLPDSTFVTAIETLYVFCTVSEVVVITASLACGFPNSHPEFQTILLHVLATALYVSHILVQFKTAVLIGWQLIDDDPEPAYKRYKGKWMPFDVAVTVPWDLLSLATGVTEVFYRIRLVRVTRLLRLWSLFQTSNPLQERRYFTAQLLLWALLTHHLVACLHYAARGCDDNWTMAQYAFSLYWAVQTTTSVGYGDATDDHTGMRWFSILVMLGGFMLSGLFIGHMSVHFMAQDHFGKKAKEQKAMLMSLMTRYEVPLHLQKEAFGVMPLIFGTASSNFAEAFSILPPFMQDKIGVLIRLKLLKHVPMFAGAEEGILRLLALRLDQHMVDPATDIINIGEPGKEMYFISTGAVEILVPDPSSKTGLRQVVILRDGSWFGEIAILKETRRTAAVRTVTACDLYVLTKEDFWKILTQHPNSRFEQAILNEVEKRLAAHPSALRRESRRRSTLKPGSSKADAAAPEGPSLTVEPGTPRADETTAEESAMAAAFAKSAGRRKSMVPGGLQLVENATIDIDGGTGFGREPDGSGTGSSTASDSAEEQGIDSPSTKDLPADSLEMFKQTIAKMRAQVARQGSPTNDSLRRSESFALRHQSNRLRIAADRAKSLPRRSVSLQRDESTDSGDNAMPEETATQVLGLKGTPRRRPRGSVGPASPKESVG
eukprot:TRINITY_DN4585_c0_g2_i1.p1 TRINITY_DN4585_c0_g2~~TRINITY_DN4585_c0_g2_i1.p1  ORF type:complete len:1022 (+),score=199.50 TRINITY_DN4585_c0_g2_i1:94-3159(+)